MGGAISNNRFFYQSREGGSSGHIISKWIVRESWGRSSRKHGVRVGMSNLQLKLRQNTCYWLTNGSQTAFLNLGWMIWSKEVLHSVHPCRHRHGQGVMWRIFGTNYGNQWKSVYWKVEKENIIFPVFPHNSKPIHPQRPGPVLWKVPLGPLLCLTNWWVSHRSDKMVWTEASSIPPEKYPKIIWEHHPGK